MPAKFPKPCRKTNCPNVTTERAGYCSDHMATENTWNKWQQIKGNVTQRGYGHRWRKIRTLIIERDSGLCQQCIRNGRVTAGLDVDHILPKSQGGSDNYVNLELLCRACHNIKTAGGGVKSLQPTGK